MNKLFLHEPHLGVMEVFESSKNTSNQQRLLKGLYRIFLNNSNNQSTFILEFLQCLAVSFTYMEKHIAVENSLEFAANYCIYHGSLVGEEENVILLAVFEFIFDNHDRKLAAIRYRACEFANRLLIKMGPQASLDNDIYEKLALTMMERLQDKAPSIRAQAVMALQRLQDPTDKDCRIIRALCFHMEADPIYEVRARVVQNIAITQKTLTFIIKRLQDVKDLVRKEAYKTLNRLKPQKFSIRHRQAILSSGLSDRSELIQNYVTDTLIPNWFHSCDSNIIDFLSLIDVVSLKPDSLRNVLSYLFKMKEIPRSELVSVIERLQLESGGQKIIPRASLTPETGTLWSNTIHHLGFDFCEGKILPELTQFANFLSMYCGDSNLKAPDDQFVLIQLFKIAQCYSFMDEAGRKKILCTCIDILKSKNVGIEVIPSIIELFELLVMDMKERILLLAELVSDIREPFDTDNGNEIHWESRLDDSNANKSVELVSKEFSTLHFREDHDENTDPYIQMKCLTIIREVLKSPSFNKVNETLLTLKDYFVIDCLKSADGRVLSLAVDVLGLMCIVNLDLAKEFFLKFCILVYDDFASVSAIEAVIDILLVHSLEPFSFGNIYENRSSEVAELGGASEEPALSITRDPTLSPPAQKIISLLTSLLRSQNQNKELWYKVSEGLCKLLLSSQIDSPIVLAQLILLWFSSTTDKEPRIRQPLGMFFSVFSSKRIGAPDIILQAFVPTLRGSEELIDDIPDQGKIANLFIALLRSDVSSKIGKATGEKGSYHGLLALIVLDEIRQKFISDQLLSRVLSRLRLEENDGFIAEKLYIQAHRAHKWLSKKSDVKVLQGIEKFIGEVDELKKNHSEKKRKENVNNSIGDQTDANKTGGLNLTSEKRKRKSRTKRSSSNEISGELHKITEKPQGNKIESRNKVSSQGKRGLAVIKESTTVDLVEGLGEGAPSPPKKKDLTKYNKQHLNKIISIT